MTQKISNLWDRVALPRVFPKAAASRRVRPRILHELSHGPAARKRCLRPRRRVWTQGFPFGIGEKLKDG